MSGGQDQGRSGNGIFVETFPALGSDVIPGLVHGFVLRVPGVDVVTDRAEAIRRLQPSWRSVTDGLRFAADRVFVAAGVHGKEIAVPDAGRDVGGIGNEIPGVDGLISGEEGVLMAVMVADCCAVWLVDPAERVCGVVHSGRPGTALGIVAGGVRLLGDRFGCRPRDMLAVLSPCIRPPLYEVDFAAEIRRQCAREGISEERIIDPGICTGRRVDRYYSYRVERGRTGRMLAFIGFESSDVAD